MSGYTLVLDSMAALVLRQGHAQRAATLAGFVDHLERTTGNRLNRTNRMHFGYDPSGFRTNAETASAFAAGAAMDTPTAVAFALGTTTAPDGRCRTSAGRQAAVSGGGRRSRRRSR